ncbi:hypothetical protein [Ruegeria sp. Ofav3-42]|nr:hypothetical protein [Ruegeria sp. Ofav3-42]
MLRRLHPEQPEIYAFATFGGRSVDHVVITGSIDIVGWEVVH